MRKNIRTLAELNKEQVKLKQMIQITGNELARSLNKSKNGTRDYLLQKVAIPAGLVGIGSVAIKKAIGSEPAKSKPPTPVSSSMGLFRFLFPIGMKLLQSYLAKDHLPSKSQAPSETKINEPYRQQLS